MNLNLKDIEFWLPQYFPGNLSEEKRAIIDEWRQHSSENEDIFQQNLRAWDAIPLLKEMEQFNSFEALRKIEPRLKPTFQLRWKGNIQRWAAILLLPMFIYSGWLTYKHLIEVQKQSSVIWQTIKTPPGLKSHFQLPDGTLVWLNSASSITFPQEFDDDSRVVSVTGEAFFDVHNDARKPFSVGLGKISVKVTGTRFNVINYEHESATEIILESGKIELHSGSGKFSRALCEMKPGELAFLNKTDNTLVIKKVEVDKYCSWINGKLIFRDNPMNEVVLKLNRWFNVNIEVADSVISDYIYTASFQDESLDQILELLTISAPITYHVIRDDSQGELLTAKRIILKKRGTQGTKIRKQF